MMNKLTFLRQTIDNEPKVRFIFQKNDVTKIDLVLAQDWGQQAMKFAEMGLAQLLQTHRDKVNPEAKRIMDEVLGAYKAVLAGEARREITLTDVQLMLALVPQ